MITDFFHFVTKCTDELPEWTGWLWAAISAGVIIFFVIDEMVRGKKSLLYRAFWFMGSKSNSGDGVSGIFKEMPVYLVLSPFLGVFFIILIFVGWGLTGIIVHLLRQCLDLCSAIF